MGRFSVILAPSLWHAVPGRRWVTDEARAPHTQVHHQAGLDTDRAGVKKPRSAGPLTVQTAVDVFTKHALQIQRTALPSTSTGCASFAKQLPSTSPIRCLDIFKDDVDVVGICTGMVHDAFGDVGSNSGFLLLLFSFEPAHTNDGHEISPDS